MIIVFPVIYFVFFLHALFCYDIAHANTVTFEKEYRYQASDADSKLSCRTISLEQVKRLLLEQLGTYIDGESQVKDFKLTKDQITTLMAGIVKVEIIDEQWDGKTHYLKAKLSADPAEITKHLAELQREKQKSKESDKKVDYELVERCGKRAEEIFNKPYIVGIDNSVSTQRFESHYNTSLKKCFMRIFGLEMHVYDEFLYEVNEQKVYAYYYFKTNVRTLDWKKNHGGSIVGSDGIEKDIKSSSEWQSYIHKMMTE